MLVSDLNLSPAVLLEPDDTLADAAREMEENGISAILVFDAGVLAGILTERDLVRAAADGVPLAQTAADEYMTAAPVTIAEDTDVDGALRTMLDGEIRHLPVVGADEDVTGIATLKELVKGVLGVSEAPRR